MYQRMRWQLLYHVLCSAVLRSGAEQQGRDSQLR